MRFYLQHGILPLLLCSTLRLLVNCQDDCEFKNGQTSNNLGIDQECICSKDASCNSVSNYCDGAACYATEQDLKACDNLDRTISNPLSGDNKCKCGLSAQCSKTKNYCDGEACHATAEDKTTEEEETKEKETFIRRDLPETKEKTCQFTHGKIKNIGNCKCGTTSCTYNTNKMIQPQGYCDTTRTIQPCFVSLNSLREVRIKIPTNTSCRSAGLLKVNKNALTLATDASTRECKFSGDLCTSSNGIHPQNSSCICGTTVCSRTLGLVCQTSNNNKDSCTFASSCMDQNGILKNNKTCSCGSIHCTKTSGLYCRNQEQYDLAPLQYPCTINKPRPMCSNYEGILPNVKECQCGTNVCNIHTGLMCKANENKCKKSEGCSVQAVEAMHEQQTCATFSPRCECSECMEGHYGRKCKKCPENATIAWFYDLAVVAFCVYVSGGVLYYVFRPSNKKYKGSSMQAKKQMTQLVKVAKLGSSMATVIIAQIQILSIIMSMIVWSPSLPDWLVVYLDYLGNIFSINFVGFLSSFECTRSSTPLQRWYVSLGLPYMIAFTFILWFYSSKLWFGCKITKMDSTLNDEEKVKIKAIHKYAHLITYEIIMEAAVNVLLIGMFKTVATTAMQIFDCTPMFDEYGNQQVSKLIMDVGK